MNVDYALNVWVPRLRSDEYKQTNGHLKTSNGNCCLGVAMEGRVTWFVTDLHTTDDPEKKETIYGYGEREPGVLESETNAHRYVGLLSHDDNIFLFGEDGVKARLDGLLINMNDDLGCSFDQIADVVEQLCAEPELIEELKDENKKPVVTIDGSGTARMSVDKDHEGEIYQ